MSVATGTQPLIILLLCAEWVVFAAAAAWYLLRPIVRGTRLGRSDSGASVESGQPRGRWSRLSVAVAAGAAGFAAARLFSPGPPVLSTYTGLAHVASAFRIADMQWDWAFPPDYPLAVQVLVAGMSILFGKSPETFGLTNSVLYGLAAAGGALLVRTLTAVPERHSPAAPPGGGDPSAARAGGGTHLHGPAGHCAGTAGLLLALLPLGLLFAGGDGLSIGYLALSPWAVLLWIEIGHSPWTWAAAASCLALLVQTRPEALAFVLPLALLVVAIRRHEPIPAGERSWAATSTIDPSPSLGSSHRPSTIRSVGVASAATLLLCLPYLARYYSAMVATGRASGELGLRMLPGILGTTAAIAALIALIGARRERGRPSAGPSTRGGAGRNPLELAQGIPQAAVVLPPPDPRPTHSSEVAWGLGLFGVLCAVAVGAWGVDWLTWGPVCADDECAGRTFSTIPVWLLNPKLVPLPLMALAFVGLVPAAETRMRCIQLATVVWLGVLLAAASTKATGELPFDGARTQLPASIPLVLLAALGLRRLQEAAPLEALAGHVLRSAGSNAAPAGLRPPGAQGGTVSMSLSGARRGTVSMALAVALAIAFAVPGIAAVRGVDFDEQRELRFVRECLPRLEERSVLYAADDEVDLLLPGDTEPMHVEIFPLFRMGFMLEALGDEARGIRVAEASQLRGGDGPQGRRGSSGREAAPYFLRGLACFRTGERAESRSCAEIAERFRLEPVCEAEIPNLPFTSDFRDVIKIVGEKTRVGIYRLETRAR